MSGKIENLEELRRFEEEWTENMCTYWRERMHRLHVWDTGHLNNSLQGRLTVGEPMTIEHKFAMYGIYIAAGVGGDMTKKRNSLGQLEFFDNEYREEHGLNEPHAVGPAWSKASLKFPRNAKGRVIAGGRPRVKRNWFSYKYISSVRKLNEVEAAAYGDVYQGALASALEDIFGGKGVVRNL